MNWAGQVVESTYRFVSVYFTNINNAANPITATALAGELSNGYTLLETTSVDFIANNLVPYYVEPPVITSIYNVDAKVIDIEFDKQLIDVSSQSGYVVSGYEPSMVPSGSLVPTTYELYNVAYKPVLPVYSTNMLLGSFNQTSTEFGVVCLSTVEEV